jgi:hypothetical protein
VDHNDFILWQSGFGILTDANLTDGDADGDGDVDGFDFLAWQSSFGSSVQAVSAWNSVPEPNSWVLTMLLLYSMGFMRFSVHNGADGGSYIG